MLQQNHSMALNAHTTTPFTTRLAAKLVVASPSSTLQFAHRSPRSSRTQASALTGRSQYPSLLLFLPPPPVMTTMTLTPSKSKTQKMLSWTSLPLRPLAKSSLSTPPFATRWPRGTHKVPFPTPAGLLTLVSMIRSLGTQLHKVKLSCHVS